MQYVAVLTFGDTGEQPLVVGPFHLLRRAEMIAERLSYRASATIGEETYEWHVQELLDADEATIQVADDYPPPTEEGNDEGK